MGIREDAEMIGLQLLSDPAGGAPMGVLAWGVAVIQVLQGIALDPIQQRLAVDVIQQWGLVVPYRLGPQVPPRLLSVQDIPNVRKLFDDAWHIATMVRIFRPLLPHSMENADRDEKIILEARTFCEKEISGIEEMTPMGTMTIERWVFDVLVDHCKELLHIVLGDRKMDQFVAAYDQAMAGLRQMSELAAAPKV